MDPDPRLATVLVVDDNVNNLRLLHTILESADLRVRLASAGDMAIASARADPPDLVLLDVNMPGINGFETCVRLKSDALTAGIPVLFVSALNDEAEIVEGYAAGGVDFIVKPFQAQVLVARVRTHVALARTQAALRIENEERRAAEQVAEDANRAKSEFLAHMSHEIRTPMNAILGITYLTLQTALDERQQNYLHKVHRSAQSLLGIINDILDFSKIEAGKLDLRPGEFELQQLLADFANLVGLQAEEKSLELLFDLSANLPPMLYGDAQRLGQVLVNLGNNAVKFTTHGEVVVAIKQISRGALTIQLGFEVRDTGPGMDAATVARLFQPFMQAEQTRSSGGTGLGLMISQRLVHMMGGRLQVSSTPGHGTCFHFALDLGLVQAPDSTAAAEVPDLRHRLAHKHLLIVDDNATARRILSALASEVGMLAAEAASAEEAARHLVDADAAATPCDLMLLDWKAPGLEDVECVRRLARADAARRPLVLMTAAFGGESILGRLAHAGLSVHEILVKPVTPATMVRACALALGLVDSAERPLNSREAHLSRHRARLAGQRLLLVEDNPINQELAVALLEETGIVVAVAEDGRQALDMLAAGRYDGVLMDCQMPRMDGYDATRRIRADPRWRALPVIAMTANATFDDRDRAFAAGMDDYVSKPIIVAELYETLVKWVARDASGDAGKPTPTSG